MPLKKMLLKPGVNTQLSQTLNESGSFGSNLIRWRNGLPEKLGGWSHLTSQNVIGTVRSLHAWADLSGISYLAYGSDQRLQVYSGGIVTDITPILKTTNAANILSTTSGSKEVEVHDPANGSSVGDTVILPIPVAIGGLLLQGSYTVDAVIDSDHYTFAAPSNAGATVSGGGATPAFATTSGLATVTVTLANHGLSVNAVFTVQANTSVGGLTINGQYLVKTVIDANNFTITANSNASSTASASENGGDVQIEYLLPPGPPSDMPGAGWGSGDWGSGDWGESTESGIIPLRNWSLGNFGQNLVAVPTNGELYQWVPPVSSGNVAAPVTQAPTVNWAMFVAMPQEQVVLLGASVAGVQDPMLIAWCDAGNITVWTATAANQAGTFRLPRGSKIMGGLQGPQFGLIWTDIELWGMQYIQPPFIYSFLSLGAGCGLVAPKAACVMASNVYWMSTRQFFALDGEGLHPIRCDVWDQIFRNLDQDNLSKILAAPNSSFNEVAWFYPSAAGSGEIDSYVKYNILEGEWDYGSLVRTAWLDQSVFGPPIGVDNPSGLLQQHEIAVDADGAAMTGVSLLTGYFDLEDGTLFIFLDKLIPDFVWTGSTNAGDQSLTLTAYAVDYPGDTPTAHGPFTITSSSQYVTIRTRARQIALKIESDGLGVFWRLGALRYWGGPDGRV